jgi:hypothetical protein
MNSLELKRRDHISIYSMRPKSKTSEKGKLYRPIFLININAKIVKVILEN